MSRTGIRLEYQKVGDKLDATDIWKKAPPVTMILLTVIPCFLLAIGKGSQFHRIGPGSQLHPKLSHQATGATQTRASKSIRKNLGIIPIYFG